MIMVTQTILDLWIASTQTLWQANSIQHALQLQWNDSNKSQNVRCLTRTSNGKKKKITNYYQKFKKKEKKIKGKKRPCESMWQVHVCDECC